jgi:hypothetical protein
LRRQGHDHRGGYVRYAAKASACDACPLKSKCTNRAKGHWVSRSLEEDYLERVRAYRDTEPYRKALRKRAVWVEPLFAEDKGWHGAGRFRLRWLEKVNTEVPMTAAGQNVKRLLAFGTRRPKRPSQAAALRRPEASRREFHGTRRHGRRCPRGPARPFSTGWHLLRSLVALTNALGLPYSARCFPNGLSCKEALEAQLSAAIAQNGVEGQLR